MVKAWMSHAVFFRISALTTDESSPPLKNVPAGRRSSLESNGMAQQRVQFLLQFGVALSATLAPLQRPEPVIFKRR